MSPLQPTHHPAIETLTSYAAGTLRAGFDLVTAVHVAGCARCREELAVLEGVGGLMLEDSGAASLEPDALARAIARLDMPAVAPTPSRGIQQLLASAKRRWVAPGVWVAKIDTPHAPEDRVYLLSAAPGAATAMHTHSGLEFTQIVSGALEDQGVVYRAGDFAEHDTAHTHRPLAFGSEPCVCLFATHGRLVPTGLIGRLAFIIADV